MQILLYSAYLASSVCEKMLHKCIDKLSSSANYAEYNKICMDGSLKFPVKPKAESKFKYHNYIGFGSTCQDHTIHIDGHTVVSSQQTEYSSKSQEAKYCKHYTEKAGKLWEKIMSY